MAELSCPGIIWLTLSAVAAMAAASGFFLPYWIRGVYTHPSTLTSTPTPVFLGIFRRCNYPRMVANSDGDSGVHVEMVLECGRYTRFTDIPSVWWQIGTVICGTGAAVALLVAMAGAWALCVRYVLTKGTAKVAAILQFVAAVLVGGGVSLYPLGWSSTEVQEVCGPEAASFQLGTCELYWAFYLTASAGGLTLICSLLALCAPSAKADYS